MPGKIPQHVVLYMPAMFISRDATCGGCEFYNDLLRRCSLFSDDIVVNPTDGCGLYVKGKPHSQPRLDAVSSEVAGFTRGGPFTCQRCKYHRIKLGSNTGECAKVEGIIERGGCCNAWEKERRQDRVMGGSMESNL
jgi:hypothetical protein